MNMILTGTGKVVVKPANGGNSVYWLSIYQHIHCLAEKGAFMKKIISLLVTICVLMGATGVVSASAEGDQIFYIGETETVGLGDVYNNIVKVESLDNIICTEQTKIVTTAETLNNSKFEGALKEALKDNSRIFVVGELMEEDVREFFDLPVNAMVNQKELMNTVSKDELDGYGEDVEVVNVAEFPMLGQMVYQDEGNTNVTCVYVESLSDSELIADAIDYCFEYDYLEFSGVINRTGDFSNSWSNVDISTKTYQYTRATITTSIGIDRNDGNPNSDGEYLFYVPYKVDVDIAAPYAIHNVKLDLAGNRASKVYDYGPKDVSCDANASVSSQLPKAISVSFTPGTKVAISKVSGGLDSNNFAVEYQPKNFLAVDSYTSDRMQCEAHIEGYQTGSYFKANGNFRVETYKRQQPSGGQPAYVDPLIITNNSADSAAGS